MFEVLGMSSPNVLKLVLMLEECGFDYRLRHVDVFAGQQFDPAFLAISPNNKVPVLIDQRGAEPFAVFESASALLYLSEASGLMMPADAHLRSRAMSWLMLQTASVGPMFGQYVHFFRYAPEDERGYGLRRYESEAVRILGVLERRLAESPNLAGGEYGLADVATLPWIRTADSIFPLFKREGAWNEFPALRRWFEAGLARPATGRAVAALDALLSDDVAAFGRADSDAIDRFCGRGRHDHSAKLSAATTA
ncbi:MULTISPECIES: glutathione S-transferase C-terminal domain-containing protein [Sphingomonas]|uniref:Glutathione S-transferase n=1 Tax=Edaphosphingomonas fennica TaxID=114404 RepID=A0A2T4HU79_9SPHN|nr:MULTISPECIES: glutathione S-transferase C-terminal domain-containing protein [Sphingomonas]AGH48058.1 GST-like protein [Sphingomonas sp. MM-1]PTD19345.1 glutathione S-transferase [Sphingomonas fennica]